MRVNNRIMVNVLSVFLLIAFVGALVPLPSVSAADTDVWRQSASAGFGQGDANLLAGPIVEHDGSVFSATAGEDGLMVYKKTATGWEAASTAGFGDTGNMAALGLKSYAGNLYAGTANMDGCGVWRYDGGTAWTQIIGQDPEGTATTGPGFGNNNNLAVGCMEVFDGKLYAGLVNYNIDVLPPGSDGSEIWSYNGSTWEKETSSAGGFGNVENAGILGLKSYNGKLYATTLHFSVSYNFFTSEIGIHSKGWELWQKDGSSWTLAAEDPLDEATTKNIGIMAMETFGDDLYMGTINIEASAIVDIGAKTISSLTLDSDGSEVLKYDGTDVTPVMQGGFGDTSNIAILSMCTTEADESGTLLATSGNVTGTGLSDLSASGVIKSFNGSSWNNVSAEGFGNPDNMLIFSLLNDSGNNTYAGTANEAGCEVWWWPNPSLDSITPDSGIQGEVLSNATISGNNLNQIKHVSLNNGSHTINGAISSLSSTEIMSGLNLTGAPTGAYDLKVFDHLGKCATLNDAFTVYNPSPAITGLDPAFKPAGAGEFVLTVNGTGFVDGSVVRWDGNPKSTEYVNGTQLTATIPASDIADGGKFDITVFSTGPGGGVSNTQAFTVINPPPTIVGLDPESKMMGEGGFNLTVNGTGFVPGSKVMWNSDERDTTFVNGNKLAAQISAADISKAGTAEVAVFNTGPVGGLSNAQVFTIEALPTPSIFSINPTAGTAGSTVTINGADFGSSRGGSTVKFGSKTCAASDYASWSDTQVKAKVPNGVTGTVQVKVTTAAGTSNGKGFTVIPAVLPPEDPGPVDDTWYLAEGTTDWGFDTYVSVQNPNDEEVNIEVTYMTSSGPVEGGTHKLQPTSQLTINPGDTLPAQDFSTKVECTDDKNIAVDRTMIWTGEGAASPDGHCSVGVTEPDTTWYLAEGSSDWGFECWLLIQNPNAGDANCTITYMTAADGPIPVDVTVPGNSRASYSMEAHIGQKDASIKVESPIPVIPERAMYRNNRREGHDSIGTTTPAQDYYLAEGATGYGPNFVTWVLVQNPNDEPANVALTYLTSTGEVPGPTMNMPANSRWTVKVNDDLPEGSDVSTHVHGDKPIIAERAMYWNNGLGEACHDSIGMAAAHKTFYLPDGETSNGRETWTLVSNPNDSNVTVRISYLTPTGQGNVEFEATIPANSRSTFNMADKGIQGRAAILVESLTEDKNIMCERAMYWNNRGAGTDTIGGYSD